MIQKQISMISNRFKRSSRNQRVLIIIIVLVASTFIVAQLNVQSVTPYSDTPTHPRAYYRFGYSDYKKVEEVTVVWVNLMPVPVITIYYNYFFCFPVDVVLHDNNGDLESHVLAWKVEYTIYDPTQQEDVTYSWKGDEQDDGYQSLAFGGGGSGAVATITKSSGTGIIFAPVWVHNEAPNDVQAVLYLRITMTDASENIGKDYYQLPILICFGRTQSEIGRNGVATSQTPQDVPPDDEETTTGDFGFGDDGDGGDAGWSGAGVGFGGDIPGFEFPIVVFGVITILIIKRRKEKKKNA